MRFLFNRYFRNVPVVYDRITASPEIMARCLDLLNPDDSVKGLSRFNYARYRKGPNEVYLFRSGAKLGWDPSEPNKWWIYGYASDKQDISAAYYELRAANRIRLAVQDLETVDVLLHTPEKYKRVYTGLKHQFGEN